ncbi:hypothetical protein B0H10DRAFT_2223846 [Mycena sp. CBHHK59/15]|nr:hypothetical protein B0H10DRAFT_2223846 [Mycena sp. CBHHK59/15]
MARVGALDSESDKLLQLWVPHQLNASTSGSSLAHQYAAYGATGGHAAYARHRQDSSMDSVMSDYSVARLGCPSLGERMLDTAGSQPLPAISVSPPESRSNLRNRSSFDSIIDEEQRSSMEDSLFEKTSTAQAVEDMVVEANHEVR